MPAQMRSREQRCRHDAGDHCITQLHLDWGCGTREYPLWPFFKCKGPPPKHLQGWHLHVGTVSVATMTSSIAVAMKRVCSDHTSHRNQVLWHSSKRTTWYALCRHHNVHVCYQPLPLAVGAILGIDSNVQVLTI